MQMTWAKTYECTHVCYLGGQGVHVTVRYSSLVIFNVSTYQALSLFMHTAGILPKIVITSIP